MKGIDILMGLIISILVMALVFIGIGWVVDTLQLLGVGY